MVYNNIETISISWELWILWHFCQHISKWYPWYSSFQQGTKWLKFMASNHVYSLPSSLYSQWNRSF